MLHQFECPDCQRTFRTESALNMHRGAMHRGARPPAPPPLKLKGSAHPNNTPEDLMNYTPPTQRSWVRTAVTAMIALLLIIVALRVGWPYIAAWMEANGYAL